jgi:hypothetical protein
MSGRMQRAQDLPLRLLRADSPKESFGPRRRDTEIVQRNAAKELIVYSVHNESFV